jgi:co-chaperonin GroES (HSP10)
VQEGDRVVFNSYAGMEIVFEEEQLLILSEDEILAILD